MDESYSSGSATGDDPSICSRFSSPSWNGSPDRRRVKKAGTAPYSTRRPHPGPTKKCLSKNLICCPRMYPCADSSAPNSSRTVNQSASAKEDTNTIPVLRGSLVSTPHSARCPPSLAPTYSVFDEDSRDTNSDFDFDKPDPADLPHRSCEKRKVSSVQITKSQPVTQEAPAEQLPSNQRPQSVSYGETGSRACSPHLPDNSMAREAAKVLLGSIFAERRSPRAGTQFTDESNVAMDNMPDYDTRNQQTPTTHGIGIVPLPTTGAAESKTVDVVNAGHKQTPPPSSAVSTAKPRSADAASAELKRISRRVTLKSFAKQEKITYGQACLIYAADPSLIED